MSKNHVIVNGLTVVHKGSEGVATASAPDVCWTPTSDGMKPLPYPNSAKSSDLVDGTTTVLVDGNSVAVEGCAFGTSTGDEAGVGGGVVSGVNKGKAKFSNYSFDVMIEGRCACRLGDPMTMNGNGPQTMTLAETQEPAEGSIRESERKRAVKNKLRKERLESTLAWDEFRELAQIMDETEFLIWVTQLFSADIPEKAYRDLRSALLDGSFPNPKIRLVDGGPLGHVAAYDNQRRIIFVSRLLVLNAREDNEEAWKLAVALLEEFGHHVDNMLRNQYSKVGGDSPLDEGVRVAYALVNLGWAEQDKAKFATFIDDQGESPLEVEFGGLKDAIQKFLNKKEEEEDEKSGDLEFFGAGRGTGKAWSYGHESIEDSLAQADFNLKHRHYIYFGNWLRDNSQINDPKIIRKPSDPPAGTNLFTREALTQIMDVLAREEFEDRSEFRVTPEKLGVYRNEEHIDNPFGIEDGRARDPDFRGACLPVELEINPATHMKRYIRSGLPAKGRQAREYKVQDGDTLENIARKEGLTWQELARYNFGTSEPEKVNRLLPKVVGCTSRKDGYNYDFSSKDKPGIVRIPGVTSSLGSGEVATVGYVTALGYIEKSLRLAVSTGKNPEGFRLLGQGLHTLEDYYAHTNFVEVALCHLGYPVEPWVPQRPVATELPITSGSFGVTDTSMSMLYLVCEKLTKEEECIAGKETAGSKILMILLKDAQWNETRKWVGGIGEYIRAKEKEYEKVATFSCKTIGRVMRMVKSLLGVAIQVGASQIDDAQTAYSNDPSSTNPTHSQLAKDHEDHPLHILASQLAAGASKDVGMAIQRAWSGAGSADEVVATASQYIVHPADILAGRSSAWVLPAVDSWARSHSAAVNQLSVRSWSVEWSKRQSQNLKEMQRKAGGLSGSSSATLERLLKLLKGRKQ